MTQYLITKREECSQCVRGYRRNLLTDEQIAALESKATTIPVTSEQVIMDLLCPFCTRGYIDTQVDANAWLLEMLGEVRFGIGRDDGRDCLVDPRWNSNEIV